MAWFVSNGSYSYPCLPFKEREQQFDQYDQVEEERGRAQSRASNKDVNLVRLDAGSRPTFQSGVSLRVWSVGLVPFCSPRMDVLPFLNQTQLCGLDPAGAEAPEVDRELAGHRHDRFLSGRAGGERAFA